MNLFFILVETTNKNINDPLKDGSTSGKFWRRENKGSIIIVDVSVGIRWFMSWIIVRAEDVQDYMKDLFCSLFCSVWKESEFWRQFAISEPYSYIHLTSLE